MKGTEFLAEEIFTYVYKQNIKKIQQLETEFSSEIHHNQQQFVEWVLYDYITEEGNSYADAYININRQSLTSEQTYFLEECISQYFGIYEVTKIKGKIGELKDVFTGVKTEIDISLIDEEIALYSLILGRISKTLDKLIGTNIIVLPYHFKTILTGQIIENYQLAKSRDQYLTYEAFLKKNMPKVLAIVERLMTYRNEEGDVTVYQSSYAISDKQILKNLLSENPDIKYDKEDEIYHFMCGDEILAELVINSGILEIECNSQEDRKLVKNLMEEMFGETLHHLKDEELTIDDII